jgi:hypothetical protein
MERPSPPCKVGLKITKLPGFLALHGVDYVADQLAKDPVFTERCRQCPAPCNDKHQRLLDQAKGVLVTALNKQAGGN